MRPNPEHGKLPLPDLLSKSRAHLAGVLCIVLLEAVLQSCILKPQQRPLLDVWARRRHAVVSALTSCGRCTTVRLIRAGRCPLPGAYSPNGWGRCAISAAVHAGHGALYGTWCRGGASGGGVASPVGGARSGALVRCQGACVASWCRAGASGGCVAGALGCARVWLTLMGSVAVGMGVSSRQIVGESSAGEGGTGMCAALPASLERGLCPGAQTAETTQRRSKAAVTWQAARCFSASVAVCVMRHVHCCQSNGQPSPDAAAHSCTLANSCQPSQR